MTSATALAIVLSLTSFQGAQAAVPQEPAPLQGAWGLVSTNGTDLPDVPGMQAIMTFSGNKWDMKVQENVAGGGTFTVNASVAPMTINMLIEVGGPREKGQTQLGIFDVKDGVLRMALAEPGLTTRPADFTLPSSNRGALLVLRKK